VLECGGCEGRSAPSLYCWYVRIGILIHSVIAPSCLRFHSCNYRVGNILEGLVSDEIRHISYTARFIESWCSNGDTKRISSLYRERLDDFNRLTIAQTQSSVQSYGQGKFPNLLEI
jgi:hypothetical protein